MKARKQRMIFIGVVLVCMLVSAGFAYRAFQENLLYYFSPTQVNAGEAPLERRFRLGGLVEEGSIQRTPGELETRFVVTDYANTVQVEYDKVFPDLFAEGKGVVVHGEMNEDGLFVAETVLAKHDENYNAPEVEETLAIGRELAGE
jgi:cytochrome c-type biogenesis protein CcmE